MFQRRKFIYSLLLSALLPVLAGSPLFAQTSLSPQTGASSLNTLTFTWTNTGAPFVAALSTSANFSAVLSTGTPAANTTTYLNLNQNTTYYFRVKSKAESDSAYAINSISTATWVAAPSGLYFISSFFTADSQSAAGANIGWNVNGNPEWTAYDLQYSKNPGFTPSAISQQGYPPVILGGLDTNTTYYFEVRARGVPGTATPYTPGLSTATLAVNLSDVSDQIFETSATLTWTPVLNSEGYRVHLSTTYLDIALNPPATTYWQTPLSATSSKVLAPLTRNTVYYYRVGTLNWNGAADLTGTRGLTTLAAKPQNLVRLAVTDGSAALGWTAMPASPASASAFGYQLEASTANFSQGATVISSTSYGVARSTLSITTLDPNTTYYFRTSSLNADLAPNYTASQSSVTLSLALSANPELTSVYPAAQSLTVTFWPLIPEPQAFSCEGYRLEATTGAFGGSAPVFSSVTYDNQTDSMTLTGLAPNNVYQLRIATLNPELTPDYTVLPSTRTGIPPHLTGVALTNVWSSSAAITFAPGTAAEGYVAQASVDRFFQAAAISSATADTAATGLVITNLDPNTTYYYRAGSLYNGATIYTNTVPDMRETLPLLVGGLDIPAVYYSSVTMSWTPLAYSPQKNTAEGYLLEVSAAPGFAAVLASSRTYTIGLDRLSIGGLAPNTSYYFRSGTFNEQGYVNYTTVQATSTLANPPLPQVFGLTPDSINLTWDPHSNPSDTRYLVEMDNDAGYTSPLPSSTTVISSATFSGLAPNTTYYSRVTSINRLGRPTPAVDFLPMATGAYDPLPDTPAGIGVTGLTARWLPSLNTPLITNYRVQISSNTDFSGTVLSSVTKNLSAGFDGLVSNASYYMRVSALNLSGVPTQPAVPLPAALTLPTTAYILAPEDTFSGLMTDGFSVKWANNGNSSFTVYNVQASTASDFSVINSSLSVRAETCTFVNLLINTAYWVQVQAKGQAGALSDFRTAGSVSTLLSSQMSAVAMDANTITLETSYGEISVLLPQGSIGGSTRLTLTPSTFTLPSPLSAVSQLAPTGVGLVVTYFPPTLILNAITVTLPYRISDLPLAMRADRTKLILALYDEANRVWVPLPSVSDTARNRVIAQTWHLSTFQIMQAQPEAGLAKVKIYPNPYRPNSVSDVMHFTNMTSFAKVKIYTFLGELVREIHADVNGMAHWDGLNTAGRKAASGVYIAFVQSQDKKSSKSFKVALER